MRYVLIFVSSMLLFSCGSKQEKAAMLIGHWRKDSVYAYDNGFGFMKRDFDEDPLIEYRNGGQLLMTLNKEKRMFAYKVHGDTLIHQNKGREERFLIVSVEGRILVLRRDLKPIFNGKNQTRYELRYFSKV